MLLSGVVQRKCISSVTKLGVVLNVGMKSAKACLPAVKFYHKPPRRGSKLTLVSGNIFLIGADMFTLFARNATPDANYSCLVHAHISTKAMFRWPYGV